MKALVVYSTVYGGTVRVAEMIGQELLNSGYESAVFNAVDKEIPDVAGFDLVVVGSSIIGGKWNKKALGFLKANEPQLAGKRIALFVSCGDAFDPSKREKAYAKYLVKVADTFPLIQPISLGLFGGVYNPEKYGVVVKLLMKYMSKYLKEAGADLNKSFDMRDWDEISGWAGDLVNVPEVLIAPIPSKLTV
jgi:menaquinone-dependent protoporphyrinogen oxidase